MRPASPLTDLFWRGRMFGAVCCFALCSLPACHAWTGRQTALSEQAPTNAASDIKRARLEFTSARFADAEKTLRDYLQTQPHSAEALYLLGEVLMRNNQAAESLRVLTQAAAIRPPAGAELRLVGLDYVLLNDNKDAMHWLTRAAEMSPSDPDIWYSLGRTLYVDGNYAAAEAAFRKTLALDSRSVKAEDNLGLALAAQNQPDLALEAHARAIALQEGALVQSEQPFLNYGIALLHRGRVAESVAALTRANAASPTCAPCHEAAGQALLASDRVLDAQNEFERAVTLDPENARFHYELGRAYKRGGNKEKSAAELRRSGELYGSHATPP